MGDSDRMDVEAVVRLLNEALSLQMRSSLEFTWLAGSATGMQFQALTVQMQAFGEHELGDARRLIEKIKAIGGEPATRVAQPAAIPATVEGLDQLIDHESEALEALRQVIPATGHEAASEALEHLLEHIIMRKQNQIDLLIRARGSD